ncbi:type II secretion system protein J [Candidatus Hydrogenedentota bacterium]
MTSRGKHNKGWTLLEMLVVVVAIGMLVSICGRMFFQTLNLTRMSVGYIDTATNLEFVTTRMRRDIESASALPNDVANMKKDERTLILAYDHPDYTRHGHDFIIYQYDPHKETLQRFAAWEEGENTTVGLSHSFELEYARFATEKGIVSVSLRPFHKANYSIRTIREINFDVAMRCVQ